MAIFRADFAVNRSEHALEEVLHDSEAGAGDQERIFGELSEVLSKQGLFFSESLSDEVNSIPA